MSFWEIKISAVDGGRTMRSGRDQKTISVSGLPRVDQMTVASRAFVAEIRSHDSVAFCDELYAILRRDLIAIGCLIAAVPDRKNDAPFRGAVYLNPEITAGKTAGFIVRPDGIGLDRYLVVETNYLRVRGNCIGQVDRWCAALGDHAEMSILTRRTAQQQRLNISECRAIF